MRRTGARRTWCAVALLVSSAVGAQQAKHPFTAHDWTMLRSARVAAMAPDGTILYRVTVGGDKGPTQTEWWTIGADGSHAAKLTLDHDFTPMGFTADGRLYGGWKIKDQQQLAVFPMSNHKAAPVPSTVVALPRGIETAEISPDGKRFAIVADPRDPELLDEVRHVQEPEESSLYIVNLDGTAGGWWCSDRKSVDGGGIAWNADSSAVAMLSPLPHIGHHEVAVSIDICDAKGAHHVTGIASAVSGMAWTDGGTQLAFLSTTSKVLTP